jgi:hypothetical protein
VRKTSNVEIPYSPAIELTLIPSTWAIGHKFWEIRFTRQWYCDVFKDESHISTMLDLIYRNAPLDDLIPDEDQASSDSGTQAQAISRFQSAVERGSEKAMQKWENQQKVLFGISIVLFAISLAISPYIFVLNLLIALIGSRYVGGFSKVFSNALIAAYPVVKLINSWFQRDPESCALWCKESRPEYQTVFEVVRVRFQGIY